MSLTRLLPTLMVATLVAGMTVSPAPAQAQTGIVITDVELEGVAYDPVTGVLRATGGTVTGTFAGLPFTTDITDFSLEGLLDDPAGACSILHLELGPIDLDLLGLHVDTSAICLQLTAFPGQGLLGDLLCGLAGGNGLLLPDLVDALPGLLTESMAQPTQAPAQGAQDICDGECEVLDLALGPVDLTLLGLNVFLDNCEGGPVQVCVSSTAGEGLLGDLLCGLAGGIDLGDLLALLEGLGGIGDLANIQLPGNTVRGLVSQLNDALSDGALSTREINRLVRFVASRA